MAKRCITLGCRDLQQSRGNPTTKRKLSTQPQRAASLDHDLPKSSHSIRPLPQDLIESFDPLKASRERTQELPPSRYQYRPPRYNRGPLHPIQPPKASDPVSREFVPGPFSLPRLQQTYASTIAPDLLTLFYTHVPPGTPPPVRGPRLRTWDDRSPYHKNRPLRAPLGGNALALARRRVTFRNLPTLERITVSAIVREAANDSAYLHVAGMALQAITGVRAQVHFARRSLASERSGVEQRAGKPIALGVEMKGEQMWDFLGKLIELVFPGVKEWRGINGRSGDGSGNLGFGLSREVVGGMGEVAVNYDAYPPKMIPAVDVIVHTSATNDRDARLLLSGLGIPFHGKHVN